MKLTQEYMHAKINFQVYLYGKVLSVQVGRTNEK